MADKSPQAFRTIREVAEWLDVEAHVLRFWESKFKQIKPVKRAGGRRYYRPADMKLIGGIKVLLHDEGLTIRGVQKKISEEGLSAITDLSPPLEDTLAAEAATPLEASAAEDSAAPDREASQGGFFDVEAMAGDDEGPAVEPETETETAGQPVSPAEPCAAAADEEETDAAADAPPSELADEEPERAASGATGTDIAEPQREDSPLPPPTPLSEIRVLLHESVPFTVAQRAQLAPLVGRLEQLAERLRTGSPRA